MVVGSGAAIAASPEEVVFQQSSPDSANDTDDPRHQHPDEAEQEGDLSGVSDWLSAELAASLEESSVELSEGQYDQARDAIGDDYDEQLSRYVEVADESDSDSDQEAAREFEAAAENQREFTDATEQYETTYDEYQEAVEAGDDERARELARELQRLSEDVNESGTTLEENYETISELTENDLSEEQQSVADQRAEIDSQQSDVQELEFVGTELTIDAATETISFTDPLVVDGRLTTEDGEPIANEEVTFAIGEQTVTTTTDSTGAFTLTYRPTVLPLDTTALEITYEPDAGSEYADASTTVPVSVKQSEPEVTIESVTDPVAFGDEMTVTGTVTGDGDGDGAANVPVVVSLGDERLGEVETNSDGTFELTVATPGAVPAGDRTIGAELPLTRQALTSAETTDTTTVEETETQISATATTTDDDRIAVSGRLATADGRAITNQPIRILVGGTAVTTVETDDTGAYETTVDAPAVSDGSTEVTAVYDGAGTNLADAQATDGVAGLAIVSSPLDSLWWPGMIVTGLGLLVLLWVYRSRRKARSTDALPYAIGRQAGTEAELTDAATHHVPAHVLLELAHTCQQNGETNRAIRLAYAAVRTHLGASTVPGWTHWEFYNETGSQLDEPQRETLLSLTEQFERAAFAPGSIPHSAAASVITAARQLIQQSRPPSAD